MSNKCNYFGMAAEVIGGTLTPASRSSPEMWMVDSVCDYKCTWKAAAGHLTPLCLSWGQTAVWAHPLHLWRTLVKDHVMKPVMFPGEGGSKVFIFCRIKVTTQFYETISTAYHKSWQRSTLFWSRTRSKTPLPCLCPGSCIRHIYTRTLDKYTFKYLY